jgi:DNA-binding LytR/AlgR family response regulator
MIFVGNQIIIKNMNGILNRFVKLLNEKFKLLLSLGFGTFLFILFFQPFPLDRFDFNNRLLFTAGFGAIIFIFSLLVWIVFPLIITRKNINGDESSSWSHLNGFIIFLLSSVSFTFYLRYAGFVSISFYIVFKVALICIFPPLALRLYESYYELMKQNESLVSERKIIQLQIEKYEEDNLNKSIEFISENRTDNLTLLISEVILIQSADNYVEIVYQDGDNYKKKLIRNTLKNIELQIKHYSNFIRCHRACIVNMHYIEKLNQDFSNHWITLRGYPDRIPVSRQYLLKLREAL